MGTAGSNEAAFFLATWRPHRMKKNRDVIVLRPDKDYGVVVMNTRDFHSKFQIILSDRSKFHVDRKQEDAS